MADSLRRTRKTSQGSRRRTLKDNPEIIREIVRLSLPPRQIEKIISFDEAEPFDVLGSHFFKDEKCVVIRAFLPRAVEAWILPEGGGTGRKTAMTRVDERGYFEALFLDCEAVFPYKLKTRDAAGYSEEFRDPYAFPTDISEDDLYLIGVGSHLRTYEKFGARACAVQGVDGVHFAVWAPNAKSVSVVGNFNHWCPGAHAMTRIRFSAVWGLFIPGLKCGEVYKFAIKGPDGSVQLKTDPYALQAELRPHTASVVSCSEPYAWRDEKWMTDRAAKNLMDQPVSIYEVHLGSWKREQHEGRWEFMNYRRLAQEMVEYVKEMGYTHIELLPIMEHPLDQSWGYQVVNYFSPTSRFGTPEDFMYFVDHCHQNGIGIILDWVPAHFPKDPHGLANFDGGQIYAYQGWMKAEHKDWGTLVFDYGRREVRNFLISNALFWLDRYHLDGLRVDAVASMLYLDYSRKEGEWERNQFGGRENLEAVDFMKRLNEIVHQHHPGVMTIAEESTAWPGVSRPTYLGGLGYSHKWNMGWMHDSLEYFSRDPVFRRFHQGMLTFSMVYAFSENFVLPISHDEVVHGKRSLLEKMPGDDWQKFANLRLFFGYMFGHPGKKLLFMTGDIAQRREWNESRSMDWHLLNYKPHAALNLFVRDLNHLYRENRAFYELDFDPRGFEWIDFTDAEGSTLSFLRWSRDRRQHLLFVFNMTPVPRLNYRIGVPRHGYYKEILNSDSPDYGGSGLGNCGGFDSDRISAHGRPYSLSLTLPPLGVNIFRFEEST